jgi:hypothetical protein
MAERDCVAKVRPKKSHQSSEDTTAERSVARASLPRTTIEEMTEPAYVLIVPFLPPPLT